MAEKREVQNEETRGDKSTKMDKSTPDPHREYLDMDTDEEECGRRESPEPEEELPPEPERPRFTDEELSELASVQRVKDLTVLYASSESDWSEECVEVVREYFRDPTKLILTIFYESNELRAAFDFPERPVDGLAYFARSPWQVYTAENFLSTVLFGSFGGSPEMAALKLLENIYAPIALESDEWPRTIKDDACSSLHSLLIALSERTYKSLGLTVLYVPREDLDIERAKPLGYEDTFALTEEDEAEIARDEDEEGELIARLEKVARYWIKQTRGALRSPGAVCDPKSVAEEFARWSYRFDDLSCLLGQLQDENVLSVVRKLKNAGSASVADFEPLVEEVRGAVEETTSNIAYLDVLIEACKGLEPPESVESSVPKILHVVRFIWIESPFYNSTSKIETICRALSSQMISRCREFIDLDSIFKGNVEKARDSLELSASWCEKYKEVYDRLVDFTRDTCPEREWLVNRDRVFDHVDAFVQRCRDAAEICEAAIAFGRSEETRRFGGSRGTEHENNCQKIRDLFYEALNKIKDVYDDILNVAEPSWLSSIIEFRGRMKELENMVKNLIDDIFEDVANAEEGVETLFALRRFQTRPSLQELLNEKYVEVWKIFDEELERCTRAMNEESDLFHPFSSYYTGYAASLQTKQNYLARQREAMINASDWLGDCDVQATILAKCANVTSAIVAKKRDLFAAWENEVDERYDFAIESGKPVLRRREDDTRFIEANIDPRFLESLREAKEWDALKYKSKILKQANKWVELKLRHDGVTALCKIFNETVQSLTDKERSLFKEPLESMTNAAAQGFQKMTWGSEFVKEFCCECTIEVTKVKHILSRYKSIDRSVHTLLGEIAAEKLIDVDENATYDTSEELKAHLEQQRDSGVANIVARVTAIAQLTSRLGGSFDIVEDAAIKGNELTTTCCLRVTWKHYKMADEDVIFKIPEYWAKYVEEIDESLEESLLLSVRRSLMFLDGDDLLEIRANYFKDGITHHPAVELMKEKITGIHENLTRIIRSSQAAIKARFASLNLTRLSSRMMEICHQYEGPLDARLKDAAMAVHK